MKLTRIDAWGFSLAAWAAQLLANALASTSKARNLHEYRQEDPPSSDLVRREHGSIRGLRSLCSSLGHAASSIG